MLDKSCSGIFGLLSLQSISSLFLFLALHMWTALFNSDHKFLEFKSRDCHCKTIMLIWMFNCCYYLVEISIYDQVLTSFNVHCLLWMQYGDVRMEYGDVRSFVVGLVLFCLWSINVCIGLCSLKQHANKKIIPKSVYHLAK